VTEQSLDGIGRHAAPSESGRDLLWLLTHEPDIDHGAAKVA
jgi:hypothetical protein